MVLTMVCEYRDWESGRSTITFISKIPGVKTTEDFHLKQFLLRIVVSTIWVMQYKVTWGEKMRPGQEFSWTNLTVNQHGY